MPAIKFSFPVFSVIAERKTLIPIAAQNTAPNLTLSQDARLERNQSKRALIKCIEGGFYFHPVDEDLSTGTPVRKKPLRGSAFGVQLL